MKKFMFLLIAMFIGISTSTFAGTKTETSLVNNSLKFEIPVSIIIKQVITFTDGKSIEVYYQKDGNFCKLYSNADLDKYKEGDLNRIKSTYFEIVDRVEGKCFMTKKTTDVIGLVKSYVNRYCK